MSAPDASAVPSGEPKITIRIIGKCTFHCPACCTGSGPSREGILQFSDFRKIVDTLAQEKFLGIVNISGGEPTLHPLLLDMLSYLTKVLPNNRIVVFTNGSWIGKPWWRKKLQSLLFVKNILVRMSLDHQHAEGALRASQSNKDLVYFENRLFAQAQLFLSSALSFGAVPGTDFDFAFKGSPEEAALYMSRLGRVPAYCIEFQEIPEIRPKRLGYFAVDIDKDGHPFVYPTLGHILSHEPLGGLDTLPTALQMNREYFQSIDK